jgi:hypothetical protein
VSYSNDDDSTASVAIVKIGATSVASPGIGATNPEIESFKRAVGSALKSAGYPDAADPAKMNRPMMLAILVTLVLYGAMVFGPVAAQLVELFPTRLRYSGVSVPYHVGDGWFGGLLPPTAFAIVAANGNIYSGLWYPIAVAALTIVVGLLFMPETKDRDILVDPANACGSVDQ